MQEEQPEGLPTFIFYGSRAMITRRKRSATVGENGGNSARHSVETRKPKLEQAKRNKEEKNEQKVPEDNFEARRQKNIAERMAFLQSLNIDGLKLDLMSTSKTGTKNGSYVRKKPKKEHTEVLPRRHSLRLQRKDPEGQGVLEKIPDDTAMQLSPTLKVERVGPLKFKTVLESTNRDNEASFLLEEAMRDALKAVPNGSRWRKTGFKHMLIDDNCVEKVVMHRITSLVVHPSRNVTLACAGDKRGYLGFFKLARDGEENLVETYTPHSGAVMCLKINGATPHHIYSSSYDETIRRADIETGVFDEVYRAPKDSGVLYFAWDGPATMTVSRSDGCVSFVDTRAPHQATTFSVHSQRVRTVDVHPVDSSYFVTASTDRTAKVWDRRNMTKKSPKAIATLEHGRACSSAFFSPLTGGKVLTTSMDNTLRIFDSSRMPGNIRLTTSIKHNNETGRWLTPFRSVWLPDDDTFVVGSLLYPRRIEAYSSDGILVHRFKGESLGTVCSVIDVHPSQPLLAGGSSSGKVYFFLET